MTVEIYSKTIRVNESSIDILGHVNNKEYFRWMEEVAIGHSSAVGWTQERYIAEKHVWVAREHWIEYLRPALLGDEITVNTWIQATEGPTSLRRYAFTRDGKLLARGATEWAHIDFTTKRIAPLPEDLRNAFVTIPEGDPRLKALGLSRPMRWLPAAVSLEGPADIR